MNISILKTLFDCEPLVFQVIISVAQLIGNVVTLSNYRFQESLALINSYSTSDKTMNVSIGQLTRGERNIVLGVTEYRNR